MKSGLLALYRYSVAKSTLFSCQKHAIACNYTENMLYYLYANGKGCEKMSVKIKSGSLRKGWGRYDIMHLDRHVASIYEDGHCRVNYPSFLPFNLYLEQDDDLDARISNLDNFYYWCASRVLTLDRKYAKEIMNSIGASQAQTDKDRAQIAISYHGLSLTDVYWIRAKNERISFSDISLYRHSLSEAFADVSLRGRQLTAQNAELLKPQDAAGDVGTSGVAPKAWVRRNGSFCLLKDGELRDVTAELLASRIVDQFSVSHVSYFPEEFEGVPVSCCKIITNEEISIVPFAHFEIRCANRGQNAYRAIHTLDSYNYDMMNIIDYLIGNTDRHWGNWGLLVNNKTNRPISLHPLMDFNKSFLAYDTEEGTQCQTTEQKLSQRQTAVDAVRRIGLNMVGKVEEDWFPDEDMRKMFFTRLAILQKEDNKK